MNNTKKINVNFSSLVGLKAELLRKQYEVNEIKLKSEVSHNIPKVKKKSKRSKKEDKNEDTEKSECINDINAHTKSKLMLEAKSRLYDRLKRSKNNNDNFLVDFTNKSDESEEELLSREDDAMLENDYDWVEYEDCFGRTRKCSREDLPFMQEKDKLLKQQIINIKGIEPITKGTAEENVINDKKEPEIEIMRRKWEDQTNKLADKANIHYQDILFDEARAHGVGYYAFSQDEDERIKQQENLFNLRKETEQKQKEIKGLKELRDKMEQNRLKAARVRQRIRAGLPVESIEEELEQKKNTEDNLNVPEHVSDVHTTKKEATEIVKKDNNEEENNKEDKILEEEDKIKALGDLLGKRNYWYEMSQEEWIHKCRKIRVTEFQPFYNNFKSAGYLNPENCDTSLTTQNHNTLESNVTNIQIEIQNDNVTDVNSFNLPFLPISTRNDCSTNYNNITEENSSQNELQTTSITQDESNNMDITNNTVKNQINPNKNIDEASITAGLRYLRRKFEESQNA